MLHHEDGSIELGNRIQQDAAAQALASTCKFVTSEALLMFWEDTAAPVKIPAKLAPKLVEGLLIDKNTAPSRWQMAKTFIKRKRAAEGIKNLGIHTPLEAESQTLAEVAPLRLLKDLSSGSQEQLAA